MHIYLLEQTENSLPRGNQWLGPQETAVLNRMRFAKRRADWRLGRWTAKRAVAASLNLPALVDVLASIEILADSFGAPEAFLPNGPVPLAISISHRAGTALCAVAPAGTRLGCDMELVESHGPAFVTDYFTPEEQTVLAHTFVTEQPRMLTMLWSAKESALKAMREGLRLDTRTVSVTSITGECDLNGWSPLQVRHVGGQVFEGWWQSNDWVLRTVVAAPRPDSPRVLELGNYIANDAQLQFVERHPALSKADRPQPTTPSPRPFL